MLGLRCGAYRASTEGQCVPKVCAMGPWSCQMLCKGSVIKLIWEACPSYSFTMHRPKALRSPAEKKPVSQMYLITDFFPSAATLILHTWDARALSLPLQFRFLGPAILHALLFCLFSPVRLAAAGGQGPSSPADCHGPLHGAGPRTDAPRFQPLMIGRGEGLGVGALKLGRRQVCLTAAPYEDPGRGLGPWQGRASCWGPRGPLTLQQAQYFQQRSSSRARSSSREMSRGMSHQKEPGGQSRRERGGRGAAVPIPHQGLVGCPLPGCQLTLLPVHQDSAVGPGGAITLHGVAVGAVVIFVPEGAVLHHLIGCTHRQSAGYPYPTPWHPRAW